MCWREKLFHQREMWQYTWLFSHSISVDGTTGKLVETHTVFIDELTKQQNMNMYCTSWTNKAILVLSIPSHFFLLFIYSLSCPLHLFLFCHLLPIYFSVTHSISLLNPYFVLLPLFPFFLLICFACLKLHGFLLFFISVYLCLLFSKTFSSCLFLSQRFYNTLWECEPSKGTERQNWTYYPALPRSGAQAGGKEGEYVFL